MAPRQRYYIFKGGRRVVVPSVTTVLKIVGDPGGLCHWHYTEGVRAVDEALQALICMVEDKPIKPSRLLATLPPYAEKPFEMPKDAAEIGTIVHGMVESDIRGLEFPRGVWQADHLEVADVAYKGWVDWKGDHSFKVEACEERLVSTVFEFGGRQDMTTTGSFNLSAEVDGRRVLTDIKTSKRVYPNHIRQLAAYGALWLENYPDRPIDGYAILRFGKLDGSHHYHYWPAGSPVMLRAWTDFLGALWLFQSEKILKGAT